jgi:aspartyl-tRNA(Asn)/glutamyl-tRNA(Gln) amidotransferase subunit B
MSAKDFQPVIGLEVHAQLLTTSKLFSGAATAFGAEPNAHTTVLCLGMPGSLPVVNKKAVELAVRAGLGLSCTINETSLWARKHYFYPDLPKGYQITQYEQPICEHGTLEIDTPEGKKRIRIRRIHMEEDAGKNTHEAGASLVDLNRAGTPLVEIVSDPDLRSADEAVAYLKDLRDVLVYLGVNDGNLEEGSFRCDANVSVMKKGATELGTRTELKNLNSFRFVKAAIEHEIQRQVEVIEAGGKVDQETRLWDTDRLETRAMRSKEDAHDYRYFPDPDLPPLVLEKGLVERTRAALPELPRARQRRYIDQLGLPEYDAGVLTAERGLSDFFDACLKQGAEPKRTSNFFMGEVLRLQKEAPTAWEILKFTAAQLAALLKKVDAAEISNNAAKEVFGAMYREGKDPAAVIAEKGLAQVSDTSAIDAAIEDVLARNADNVAAYKSGKQQVLGFLMGQVMKAMKGKGNPQLVNAALKKKLGG